MDGEQASLVNLITVFGFLIKWVGLPLLCAWVLWDIGIKGLIVQPWKNNSQKASVFYVLFFGVGLFGSCLFLTKHLPWYVPLIGISSLWWSVFDELHATHKGVE